VPTKGFLLNIYVRSSARSDVINFPNRCYNGQKFTPIWKWIASGEECISG